MDGRTRYDGPGIPWQPPRADGPPRDTGAHPVLPWLSAGDARAAPGAPPRDGGRVAGAVRQPAARRRFPTGPRRGAGLGTDLLANITTVRGLVARSPRRRLVALLAVGVLAAALAFAVGARLLTGSGHTVSTPFLSYATPPGWSAERTDAAPAADAAALSGVVHGPAYECGGEHHLRGFAAAALLPVGPSAGAGPADRAERLARWFAAASYTAPDGTAPEVTVAPPRPVRIAGGDGPVDGTVTELTARAAGERGGCPATEGTVLALAAPASGGAALLLVAGDTAGGPAEPGPPDRATLDAVLASVRLGAG